MAAAQPRSWSVDDDGPADFSNIQEAMTAANPGDTILVHNGTYYEHVTIDKPLTLRGEDRRATVIDGSLNGTAVEVVADNVHISGLTIRSGSTGIRIGSDANTLVHTNVTLNVYEGLVVENSTGNSIADNLISFNGRDGVYMANTGNNTLQRNTITSNNWTGVLLEAAHAEVITNNTLGNNAKFGVRCDDCSHISIIGNTISQNMLAGINLFNTGNSTVAYNNLINNTNQTDSYLSLNTWDSGVDGNYWSDYAGTDLYGGVSQNETRRDGIGDTPYIIDEGNRDHYPLMGPVQLFDAGTWADEPRVVSVASNSTVSELNLSRAERQLRFTLMGDTGLGFCRVTIPSIIVHDLWQEGYSLLVDGEQPLEMNSWVYEPSTAIYFAYLHSERHVVIQAADTTPPAISILSPENKTYAAKDVPLTFTVSETISWIGYTLDGQANRSLSGDTSITGLPDGRHSLALYANDTAGNMGRSNNLYFTIDTTPPHIEILSPENQTYTTTAVPLSFNIDEVTSWIGYSLDGQINETITEATTMTDLSEGTHNVVVYARDTAGNTGVSQTIHFGVEAPFPLTLIIVSALVIVAILGGLLVYRNKVRKT